MAAPIRTCIGCRRREPAAEMVRLALEARALAQPGATAGVVVADRSTSARLGRGASVHPRPACLEIALKPDVLSRAFKQKVTIHDAKDLLERITLASIGMSRKR